MDKLRLTLNVHNVVTLDDAGHEVPASYQEVDICGNKEGLLALAKLIHEVADSPQDGYHVHLEPHAPAFFRSKYFHLTIGVKRR